MTIRKELKIIKDVIEKMALSDYSVSPLPIQVGRPPSVDELEEEAAELIEVLEDTNA